MATPRGFKSVENKKITEDLKKGRSIDEIAADLGRPADVVARQALRIKNKTLGKLQHHQPAPQAISVLGGSSPTAADKVLEELQLSPTYRELRGQLTSSELRFYEENYTDLIMQFGENDTTKSEKLQIHKAVEYLIFMGRNKNEQFETIKQIEKTRLKIKNFESANPNDEKWDEDKQKYFHHLEEKFRDLNSRRSALSHEYGQLENKNQALFNDLKATRTARLTSAEKRMSITDLVSELLERDKRNRAGKQAEMFKNFTDSHSKELIQFDKYADGSFDAPILRPEDVITNAEEIKNLEAVETEIKETKDKKESDGVAQSGK